MHNGVSSQPLRCFAVLVPHPVPEQVFERSQCGNDSTSSAEQIPIAQSTFRIFPIIFGLGLSFPQGLKTRQDHMLLAHS